MPADALSTAAELAPLWAQARSYGVVGLCTVDEAGLIAAGWNPPGRGSLPDYGGMANPLRPEVQAAGAQLVERGLAIDAPGPSGRGLAPAGALRDYLAMVAQHRLAFWVVSSYLQIEHGDPLRTVQRLTTLRGEAAGLVVVETLHVRVAGQVSDSLPVEIIVSTVDSAVNQVAAQAFRPPGDGEQSSPGTELGLIGPDRKDPKATSLLVHDWGAQHGQLHWRVRGLFGPRRRGGFWAAQPATAKVTMQRYAGHVHDRLAEPEPGR